MLSTYLSTLKPQADAIGTSEEAFFLQELLNYSNGGSSSVVDSILALATTAGDTIVINQITDLKAAMQNIQAGGGGGASQQYVDDAIAALTKSSVGLGNVDNTSDANKPVSTAQATALGLKINTSARGAANGVAPLDSSSKVPTANLPPFPDPTQLIDATGGDVSVDGDTRQTFAADDSLSIDWAARQLSSVAGTSLDWANRRLLDSGIVDAIHWGNRNLTKPDGTNAANWAAGFKSTTGDTASRPASLGLGDKGVMYFDTDLNKQLWWDGSAWQGALGSSPTFSRVLVGDGDAANPSLAFSSDDGLDTGMYWLADGNIGWSCNATQRMGLSYSDGLAVYSNIYASGEFRSTSLSVNHMVVTTDLGEGLVKLDTVTNYGFDPSNYNGRQDVWNIVPSVVDENKNLNYAAAHFNPAVTGSKQTWNAHWLDLSLADDASGFQVGDPFDVKSTLNIQDLRLTSNRRGTDGDVVSIEYIGGATAGAEVVTKPSDFTYRVQIEDGVSTATQIAAALDLAVPNLGNDFSTVISGTGSNPQSVQAQTFLAGGDNDAGGVTGYNINIASNGSSNVGNIVGQSVYIALGDGAAASKGNKFSAYGGNIFLRDNASVRNISVMEYNVGGGTNTNIEFDLRGFAMVGGGGATGLSIGGGITSFWSGMNLDQIKFANFFQSTMDIQDVEQTVNVFADFGNFHGTIGQNYYGIAIQPNINIIEGGFFGLNIGPNVTSAKSNSYGLNVSMNNVTVAPGIQASLTVQDLHFVAIAAGTGNNSLQIAYVNDGTAGSESISIAGMTVTVHMEDGVSTAQQIHDVLVGNPTFNSNVTCTITGTASNPQTAIAATNLAGGVNGGSKKAAQFNGDVDIQGDLSFSGALALGALNAFHSQALVDGGGNPSSVHTLISAPTVGNNITLTSGDMLGINTAMLLSVGTNSTVGTSFLGVSALGLPAVIDIGAGSTVDKVAGATFALSLAGGGSGNIDNVYLCRSLAIPNGTTTVTNLYGYEMDLPFGGVATNSWGVYIAPDINNWMKGSLKIGGTAGSTDKAVNSDYGLDVDQSKLSTFGDSNLISGDLRSMVRSGFHEIDPSVGVAASRLNFLGVLDTEYTDDNGTNTINTYQLNKIKIAAGKTLSGIACNYFGGIGRAEADDEGHLPNAFNYFATLTHGGASAKVTDSYASYACGFHSVGPDGTVGTWADFLSMSSSIPLGVITGEMYGIFIQADTNYTKHNWIAGNTRLGSASYTAPTASLEVAGDAKLIEGHLQSTQATAPTIAASGNAGTGATASLVGTDMAGTAELDTGLLPGTGDQCTITFNRVYSVAPVVLLTPASAGAAVAGIYVTATTTDFTVNAIIALTASATIKWNYQIIEVV